MRASGGRPASRAAERVLARARSVWPEPRELRVVRGPRRTSAGEFLILPTLRTATLLVPADSVAVAAAVPGFGGSVRARQVLRLLAWAHQRDLLRWTPMARLRVGPSGAPGVIPVLRQAVPDAEAVIVWLGRPRPGRALVLNAVDGQGRALAFAKCAWGVGRDRLRAEHAALVHVDEHPLPGLRPPGVLRLLEEDDYAMLVLEAIGPGAGFRAEDGPPVPAMLALAGSRGWTPAPVSDLPVLARSAREIADLTKPESRDWLSAELERLREEVGHVPTRVGTWHGDWVEWNMVRSEDQVLLWDWEHYEVGVPPGLDHLHFLAQAMRQRAGTSPDVEDAWLAQTRAELVATWGQSEQEAEATIRVYLLILNVRYAVDRDLTLRDAPARSGWGRELIARLGGRREADL